MNTFAKIYTVTRLIPKGKVLTYRAVAQISGVKNPRIIGFALHANKEPEKIPCHRVVHSTGALAKGYAFGGPEKQREKLQKEGVYFSKEGNVDITKCIASLSSISL